MIKKIRSEIIQFLKKSNFKHLAIHNHVVHNASREFQKNKIDILFPHLLLRIFCRHLKQKKFTKKHNQKITKKKNHLCVFISIFFLFCIQVELPSNGNSFSCYPNHTCLKRSIHKFDHPKI